MPELHFRFIELPAEVNDSVIHLCGKIHESKNWVLELNAKFMQLANELSEFFFVFMNLFFDLVCLFRMEAT